MSDVFVSRLLDGLLRLSGVLGGCTSIEDIVVQVPGLAREALGADAASIGIIRGDHLQFLVLDRHGVLMPDAIEGWRHVRLDVDAPATDAARDGRATFFTSRAESLAAYPQLADDFGGLGWEAMVNVPLITAQGRMGVLGISWRTERSFVPAELDVITALASFTAQNVQRVTLLHESVNIAEHLQRAMLPKQLSPPEHFELATRYQPAAHQDVGGDWYDAFTTPGGTMTVVIGDVMGHDLPAASEMGQLRTMLRMAACDVDQDPAEVLSRVDRALHALDMHTYATAVVVQIDELDAQRPAREMTLHIASAGHLPPLLLHHDGSSELLGGPRDMMLGVRPMFTRTSFDAVLAPQATLLLYTDGLIERRNEDLDAGLARLQDAARGLSRRPLEELCHRLLAVLLPARPEDDVALIAVRYVP